MCIVLLFVIVILYKWESLKFFNSSSPSNNNVDFENWMKQISSRMYFII